LLESNPSFVENLISQDIDVSTLNEKTVVDIIQNGKCVDVRNKHVSIIPTKTNIKQIFR